MSEARPNPNVTEAEMSCPGRGAARSAAPQTRDPDSAADVAGAPDQQRTTPQGRRAALHPGNGRLLRNAAVAVFLIVALSIGAIAAYVASLGPLPLDEARKTSVSVVDRHGKLLRAYAMTDGRWRLPVDAKTGVDPRFLQQLIAYEDKRFWSHHGVDPLATGRAALQLVTRGRIVSGGSTITMQLARLMEPRRERSLGAKLRQMVRAVELERKLGKHQILDLYLALAPYGGNLEGVRAASIAYFGKEPKRLTLAESALLVALPQSPETRRLDRHPDAARAARDRVLARMVEDGVVSAEDAAQARAAPVLRQRKPMPVLAPHSADQAAASVKDAPVIRLTLDAGTQRALEALARDRATALGPDISIGIVAVDNDSGDVLAHVGSADYFDDRRAGQVDMTRAVRSPGSTLKPFIYGLAFEDGFVHPESLIDDRPVRFGAYAPENFDMTFQGTVTVRKALQLSLNVPAIELLDRVGSSRLASRLKQAGASLVLPKDEAPGLAMGLGGVGVRLIDLVQLYSGVARLGSVAPLREIASKNNGERETLRLLDKVAAWQIGNVLIGTPPPENAARNQIAFKTGTSYGYRDAWSVGFDGKITIGVWVGRPDGAPVPGLIGRVAAAPVLFDAFGRTGQLRAALPKPPRGTLTASNTQLPLPLRRFRSAGELVRSGNEQALRIQFPLNGSRIDAQSQASTGALPVKVAGGVLPMTVMVNGLSAGEIDGRRQRLIAPPGPGFVRLTVMDAVGAADTVVVRIQ
ncbi:Penicillin-binding protein 1C [Rhodopseudomonas palustris BisB5]|uniref:peptidoglycan glycosyltransferase n=1 Tax=Rhodopseudomonas palustris (strain BisB5) TaxID=316057 RepID=Q137F7_RHOPS|nr:Penicillin-binding protein 1C [Rhodopseudomonas palustris BisB5]